MTIAEASDKFIIEQQLRGNTEKTIKGYKWFLKRFTDFAEKQGIFDINQLSAENINLYQIYLNGKKVEKGKGSDNNLKKRSVQTYIRHVKIFIKFCYEQGYARDDISKNIRVPKAETPMIKILMDNEIDEILKTYENCSAWLKTRNVAIIYLLLDCGLRLNEVAGMKREDLNFEKGFIFVFGKGRKERVVPMGELLRDALMDYLSKRNKPRNEKDAKYLFISSRGRAITEATLFQMMKKLKTETGVKRIHAHLFRHTFATNYLVYGLGDVYELSRLLGHSDIRITEKYLQLANYYTIMLHRERVTYLDKVKNKGAESDALKN